MSSYKTLMSGLNPPLPSGDETSSQSSYGQRLLNLVRTLEKQNKKKIIHKKKSNKKQSSNNKTNDGNDDDEDDDYDAALHEQVFDEIVDLINSLITLYSRKGLLQGNISKAEKILSSSSSNNNHNSTTSSKNKQQRRSNKNSNKNNDLQFNNGENHNNNNNIDGGDSAQQQETLILTAILRILGQQPPRSNVDNDDSDDSSSASSSSDDENDKLLLIALAAEVCLAITQSMKMKSDGDKCAMAEYEIISQVGKELLKSLHTSIKQIQDILIKKTIILSSSSGGQQQQQRLSHQSLENCLVMTSPLLLEENDSTSTYYVESMNSCLKAAASLIGLFGIKLSRNHSILSDLNTIAWKCLTLPNNMIQKAASKVIATIPYSGATTFNNANHNNSSIGGSTKKTTPSDIWNQCVVDTVWLLGMIIETIAPVNKISYKNESRLSDNAKSTLEFWTKSLRDNIPDEADRLHAFYRFAYGLSMNCISLLKKDNININNPMSKSSSTTIMMDAKIDIESIFAVVESYLSFSISAETVYFKTKKRLRNENIEGGFISPKAISCQIANNIKLVGHSILDCLVTSMGGPCLMPYARRIIRVSYASLLTSCSGPVRKVIDPAHNTQLDNAKRKRWLHHSIPMRISAVKTFQVVTTSFGSDRSGKSNDHRSSGTIKSDGELATSLVAGCLIEEFSRDDDQNEDWGTFSERVELINQCCHCLKAALISCGGFLSDATRSLVDSAVSTGLSSLEVVSNNASSSRGNVFDWSPVKVMLLDLGSSCIVTPWNDGGASNLRGILAQTARLLDLDRDIAVSMTAKAALRVCNTVSVPRAPALLFVSREFQDAYSSSYLAPDKSTNIQNEQNNQMVSSADEIMKKMKIAREEAERTTKLAEEAEKAKRQKLKEKRLKAEQAKEEKAARKKRQKTMDATTEEMSKKNTHAIEVDKEGPQSASSKAKVDTQQDAQSPMKNDSRKLGSDPVSRIEDKHEPSGNNMETEESGRMDDDGDKTDEENNKIKIDETTSRKRQLGGGTKDDDSSDDDDEFPDINEGGPDSDDE